MAVTADETLLGPRVDGPPAALPERTSLDGRLVSLIALDPAEHSRTLYEGSHGDDGEARWRYLWDGPFADRPLFEADLERKAQSADPFYFAIVDKASREAVGYAAYLRIDPAHRVIEVGSILYTRRLQRTAGATEAMYLMARNVFEALGYRRYEWKCNALNEPSRRAAIRFGFTFEGIFRQHMIVKGRSRDTAWFSMLDTEWSRCKHAMEDWLQPSNFDAHGRQRDTLATMRGRLP